MTKKGMYRHELKYDKMLYKGGVDKMRLLIAEDEPRLLKTLIHVFGLK